MKSTLPSVIEALPLFPLPEVVFFPGTYLPLHVFEPRYQRLTEDALAGDKRLAVVLIEDNQQHDNYGQPRLRPLATVGEIVHSDRLKGGRYNIVLQGLSRARLVELPFEPPYRRARAELLCDATQAVAETAIGAMLFTATRFMGSITLSDSTPEFHYPRERAAGALADVCADSLIIDALDRQRVLETLDVRQRVQLVTETLALQEALLGPAVPLS